MAKARRENEELAVKLSKERSRTFYLENEIRHKDKEIHFLQTEARLIRCELRSSKDARIEAEIDAAKAKAERVAVLERSRDLEERLEELEPLVKGLRQKESFLMQKTLGLERAVEHWRCECIIAKDTEADARRREALLRRKIVILERVGLLFYKL